MPVNVQRVTVVDRISKYLDTAFPVFFFLLAVSFYLRTYDSAMVKITEVQMFGTLLGALWLCKIFESGHWPFSRSQTLLVLPFIAIFASGVLSFIRSPLHWGSFDFFVRRVVYIGFAIIAATEMTSLSDFRRMTKWLVWAVAVCTIYGLIQWFDFNFFPPGPPTVGLDKFVWRRAFGERVFSTFGNPNFYSNFLVIMVPLMVALYLHTRKFFYLPLVALTLVNIYWTRSKGPAMGLMAGTAIFSFFYVRFFVSSAKIRRAVVTTAAVIVLLLGAYITKRVFFSGIAITSFSFRMYTWLSTWEMVDARPVLGNGIGTFWVVYPAYRRPAIFHIEAKHNTETDHAENEHLEVWMDEGIVGMGLWIWMILMIAYGMYKALAALTQQPPSRAGPGNAKIPEEAYYVLGIASGFLGMLIHNNTDVSMRFVSSGAPFWLLAGMNAALLMYCPLPEHQSSFVHENTEPEAAPNPLLQLAMKIFRFAVIAAIAIVGLRILMQFDWCQMRDGYKNPNELPHFLITWGVFLLCWGAAIVWFTKIALECSKALSLLTILVAVIAMVPFWGFFVGDVNHNRAIFFSKQGVWNRSPEYESRIAGYPQEYQMMYKGGESGTLDKDSGAGKLVNFLFPDVFWRRFGVGGALEHYDQVNELRPDFIMAHYFRGNVYNDWGSQYAQRTTEAFGRGDVAQAEIFRKRAEELWAKAMDAYDSTRRLGPNYVQMHHQVGTVHQKWGDFFNALTPMAERYGHAQLAEEYRKLTRQHWQSALASYQLYYKIDPVYDQNYYRQAQVYINMGDLDMAEQVYIDHIQAKECKKPYHQIFGGFSVASASEGFSNYDLASIRHTHDVVQVPKHEAWLYLGDFYAYVKNQPLKAEWVYQKAISLNPNNLDFLKRLASLYGRQQRTNEAIEVWKKIYAINPNDPDVQKVVQIQPARRGK